MWNFATSWNTRTRVLHYALKNAKEEFRMVHDEVEFLDFTSDGDEERSSYQSFQRFRNYAIFCWNNAQVNSIFAKTTRQKTRVRNVKYARIWDTD